MTGWWATATREQRLAQCRGGAECGLSASDLAILLGAPRGVLWTFCARHGVVLVNEHAKPTLRRRRADRLKGEAQYGDERFSTRAKGPTPVDVEIARRLG